MLSSEVMFYIFISKADPCTPKHACASTRTFPYYDTNEVICTLLVNKTFTTWQMFQISLAALSR
jgi:hypothetical protein